MSPVASDTNDKRFVTATYPNIHKITRIINHTIKLLFRVQNKFVIFFTKTIRPCTPLLPLFLTLLLLALALQFRLALALQFRLPESQLLFLCRLLLSSLLSLLVGVNQQI